MTAPKPLDPSEITITSPRGHKVTRTIFRATENPSFSAEVHWRAARRKILTSTDVAAVLGWDKRKSAYAVYVEKTEPLDLHALANEPDLAETNEAVRWGTLLENEIAKEAGRRLGRTLIDHGRTTIFWTRDVVPGVPIGTSLDREIQPVSRTCENCRTDIEKHMGGVGFQPGVDLPCPTPGFHGGLRHFKSLTDPRGPGVGEGKTTGEFNHGEDWKPTEDDEVGAPLRAQVQVQVSMAVLGWEWGVIWGLLGGHSFHLEMREIERDPDFLAYATPRLQDFWKRVEQRDPPPADGSESTYEALKRQYPSDSGFEVRLPIESQVWDGELVAAKKAEKDAKAAIQKYGNLFRAAMGGARIGILPDGSRYSLARTKDPKPTVCPDPACGVIVSARKASRPLIRLKDE